MHWARRSARGLVDNVVSRGMLLRPVTAKNPGFATASDATTVLLPAVFGSFGDQAMAEGARAVARKSGNAVALAGPGDTARWALAGTTEVESVDSLLFGRTMVTRSGFDNKFSGRDLIVIGADTMSGAYGHRFLACQIRALKLAARSGRRSSLVNMSWPDRPTALAARFLRALPTEVDVWARDQRSQRRLSSLLRRSVEVSPDVAFAMEPRETALLRKFLNERSDGNSVTLVPNAHIAQHFGADERDVVRFWVEAGRRLSKTALVEIVVHDLRPKPGDAALARTIQDELQSNGVESRVFVPRSAAEASAALRSSDGCISARMHACVAALSGLVPTVGLEYLDKFRGQFEWFGDQGAVISDRPHESAELAVNKLLERQSTSPDTWSAPTDVGWI